MSMNRRTFLKSVGIVGAGALFFPKIFFFLKPKPKNFWVGPKGNDLNPGTPDKPLATIDEALKRIDQRARQSENRIFVLPGQYELKRALPNNLTVVGHNPGRPAIVGIRGGK